MKKWILLGVSVLGMFSLTSFDLKPDFILERLLQDENEITATINKNTTEKELEDLKEFFLENGIELEVKNIEFNEQNEITGLSLTLKKGNSKSKYSSSSNEPIEDLELGYKNNNLYITNSGMFDIAAWRNQSNFPAQAYGFDLDSLLKNQNFAFDFDFDIRKDGDSLFFNGNSITIEKLKEQMMQSFDFEEDGNGNIKRFSFNGNAFPKAFNKVKKFSFVDDPSIEKLIIIDGKESDFATLDKLAKSDQLDEVDFLKEETAVSIYGEKAKDGAIIATTKH